MGLLDLVLPGNPVSPWLDANRGKVTSGFQGMIGHGNDPRAILQGAVGGLQHGRSADEENAIIQEERKQQEAAIAQQQQQQTVTRQRIAAAGPEYQHLLDALDGGAEPSAIWGEYLQMKRPAKPAEPLKPTGDIQEYEYGLQNPDFAERQLELREAGATNIDFNQNQGAAAGFADRMTAAEAILSDPKIEAALLSVEQDIRQQVPFGMGNFLVSPEYQMADQAKRDFINAILRRESGATIQPVEFENAEIQYFPRPGDSPQVLAQKRENRRIALEGVKRAAGPNYASPSLTPGGVVDPYDKYGLERP